MTAPTIQYHFFILLPPRFKINNSKIKKIIDPSQIIHLLTFY
jgi:hypothetical protein